MKAFLYTAIAAIIFTSCGQKPTDNLSSLKNQRDSLKTLKSELVTQIKTLDEEIASLDTNKRVRITSVTSKPLSLSTFEHFFTVQGVVETDQNAQIFPEAAGKITSIKVSEGDAVIKGQILMTIDSKIINNQIDELRGRLELAKTVYDKQKKLWDQNIGSEIQFLESKNNYESLAQNIETLEAQRALYVVTAPFDGIVDEINPKEGEMANPAMPAARLINMNKMYIKSDVTERYLSKISEGDSVIVNFPSVNLTNVTAIERIGNFINPNNRSFKIKLMLNNESGKLKPNMLGELNIRDYMNDSTVVIPSSLIQMTPSGEEFVYVVDNSSATPTAKKVSIKSGMSFENNTEVLSGLKGTEEIIEKGARSIKNGDLIRIEA